jgi:hypothetical protein
MSWLMFFTGVQNMPLIHFGQIEKGLLKYRIVQIQPDRIACIAEGHLIRFSRS